MLRIAILGVGWAGTRHVEAIRELGGRLTPACLVDSDTSFLRRQSAELGVDKTYPDYREALADPAVDAVSICLPHTLHANVAVAAAQAGKHILCEKPMAMSVEEATRMIEAADANGVKLYVAENQSYTARAKLPAPDRAEWTTHWRTHLCFTGHRLSGSGVFLPWTTRMVDPA